jgi:hypothetical protein
MHQSKPVVDLIQRLGLSQEQISSGQQVGIEMLYDLAFGVQIEVDEDIAAENQVKTP